jgi:hypothetical protein
MPSAKYKYYCPHFVVVTYFTPTRPGPRAAKRAIMTERFDANGEVLMPLLLRPRGNQQSPYPLSRWVVDVCADIPVRFFFFHLGDMSDGSKFFLGALK